MKTKILHVLTAIVALTIPVGVIAGMLSSYGTSPAVSSPVVATYPAASYGRGLAEASIRDTSTVMYCAFDAPSGSVAPQCGLNALTHMGAGPFDATHYFDGGSGLDALGTLYAGDDYVTCIHFRPTTLASQQFLLQQGNVHGQYFTLETSGKVRICNIIEGSCAESSNVVTLNASNLVCGGNDSVGGRMFVQLNGGVAQDAATENEDNSISLTIGSDVGGSFPFQGYIFEALAERATTPKTVAAALWAQASTCRNAGSCLAETIVWLNRFYHFDVGSPGAGSVSPYLIGGPLFDITDPNIVLDNFPGPMAYQFRYMWPSLAWTTNGTPPKATVSNLYPKGFGADHRGLSGWSNTKYLSLGTGADIMDQANFLACAIFAPSELTTTGLIASDGATNAQGWQVVKSVATVYAVFNGGAGFAPTTVETLTSTSDNVFCWGIDGGTKFLWSVLNDGAVHTTAAFANYAVDSTHVARIGTYDDGTSAFAGAIKEFYFTRATPTAALMAKKATSALSCTAPGPCIEDDTSTYMHCYLGSAGDWLCPINSSSTINWAEHGALTRTAPAKHVWPSPTDKRDMEGVGPYSALNWFSLPAGNVLAFPGDFTHCFVVGISGTNAANEYYRAGDFGGNYGVIVDIVNTNVPVYSGCVAGLSSSGQTSTSNGVHIHCFGASDGKFFSKLDTAASTNGTCAVRVANPGVAWMGATAGNYPADLPIYEMWASSTPWSDANVNRIVQTWLDHQGSLAETITEVRADNARTTVDGVRYEAPASSLRSPPKGHLYASACNNHALYSEQLDNATYWATGSATVTADQGVAMDGRQTLDLITGSGNPCYVTQVVAPAGTIFVASGEFRAASGSHVGTIGTYGGGAAVSATCACWRSDGKACTAVGLGGTGCEARGTFDSLAAVRLMVYGTWNIDPGAGTMQFFFRGGTDVAFDTILAGAGQFEIDIEPHQYCGPVLNVLRSCNNDTATVANPLKPAGTNWTNRIWYSERQDQWVNTGTAVVVANAAQSPDGSFTAEDVTVGAGGLVGIYIAGGGFAVGPVAPALWIKRISTVGTLVVANPFGAAFGQWNVDLSLVGSDWVRLTSTTTGVTVVNPFTDDGAGNAGIYLCTAAGTANFYAWGAQETSGSTVQQYCRTPDGVSRTCGPGGASGKVVTNLVNSRLICGSGWACDPTVTMVTGDAACPLAPDGTQTMVLVTAAAGLGVTGTGAGPTRSWWLARPTADADCTIADTDGSVGDAQTRILTGTPTRYASTAGSGGMIAYRPGAGNCPRWCQWHPQIEAGTTGAGPFCGPVSAPPATCGPEQHWCIRAKNVTLDDANLWNTAGGRPILETNLGVGSNSIVLSSYAGTFYLDTFDGLGREWYCQPSLTLDTTPPTPHTFIACANNGVPELWIDGTKQVGCAGGAGDARIWAWADTWQIGRVSNALIEQVDFNSTGNSLDFAP